MFRAIRVVIGYAMLLVGGVSWFICFPLTAYLLYSYREFPFTYFGVSFSLPVPLEEFVPRDMWPALAGVCVAFTLYGLFVIYFDVRKLRRLRLGETGRRKFPDDKALR
jgi:hypothetical protein